MPAFTRQLLLDGGDLARVLAHDFWIQFMPHTEVVNFKDFDEKVGQKLDISPDAERHILAFIKCFCLMHSMRVPRFKNIMGLLLRFCSKTFWRRRLRKLSMQAWDAVAREAQRIYKQGELYCSDFVVKSVQAQDRFNCEYMETTDMVNDLGEVMALKELAAGSESIPEHRFASLMTRMKGYDQYATKHGDSCLFATLTAPSKYHSMRPCGKPNVKYNGSTPKETHQYLCGVWSRIRAKLKRDNVYVYGFRIAEPHHDGTPHAHFVLYMPEAHFKTFEQTFSHHALAEDGGEQGALLRRCNFKHLTAGGGAAYVVKYIAKNTGATKQTGGEQLGLDIPDQDIADSKERVKAWARTYGIRQFQQIGGASVSVWREARRAARLYPKDLNDGAKQKKKVWLIVKAATDGDFCGFCEMMGTGRDQVLRIAYAYKTKKGDGFVDMAVNAYGEIIYKIEGIRPASSSTALVTRLRQWEVIR